MQQQQRLLVCRTLKPVGSAREEVSRCVRSCIAGQADFNIVCAQRIVIEEAANNGREGSRAGVQGKRARIKETRSCVHKEAEHRRVALAHAHSTSLPACLLPLSVCLSVSPLPSPSPSHTHSHALSRALSLRTGRTSEDRGAWWADPRQR